MPVRASSTRSTEGDPRRVFQTLNAHHVSYMAIGGVAVQVHGHVRTTQDIDVLCDPDPQNIERLAGALRELDARLLGVDAHLLGIDPTSPRDLAQGANFTLETNAGRLDVFTDPAQLKGSAPWDEVDGRAVSVDLDAIGTVRIVGLDDLLAMKRSAGRERDLKDIAALTHRAGNGAAEPQAPDAEQPPGV